MNWKAKLGFAILQIIDNNDNDVGFEGADYPSAMRINQYLNRYKHRGLNGRECKFRTELFKLLGIKKKINQYL